MGKAPRHGSWIAVVFGTSLVVSVVISSAAAQDHPRDRFANERWNAMGGNCFARSVCALGDLDGDGVRDWAVGVPKAWIDGQERGCVLFLSGRDQKVLRRIDGEIEKGWFGYSILRVGDLDGDRFEDLAVGVLDIIHSTKRRLTIVSGRDGRVLQRIPGRTTAITRIDDPERGPCLLLADHHAEFEPRFSLILMRSGEVVATRMAGETSAVIPVMDARGRLGGDVVTYLVAAAPGIHLTSATALEGGTPFIAAPGDRGDCQKPRHAIRADFDLDGTPDLAVSFPDCDNSAGRVVIYSGRTREPLLLLERYKDEKQKQHDSGEFGESMLVLGDINEDGVPDLCIGAPEDPIGSGELRAYSGKDGKLLWSEDGGLNSNLGVCMDLLDDLDGDGVPEILVGSVYKRFTGGFYANGTVQVFSGRKGELLTITFEQDFPELAEPKPPAKDGK